jgi:MSHA biogenesis protein MshG
MPNFKYSARDNFAKFVSGVLAASTKEEAAKKLQEMGYFPLSIGEVHDSAAADIFKRFSRVSLEDINAFTRQLYSLQKAGLPLLSGLETMAQQTANRNFKSIIEDLARSIRGGMNFSDALKKYTNIFGEVYVSMIRAAETSGRLVDVLLSLNNLIEQEIDTRSRINAATRYPMLAFFVLCVGFLIVVTFVIPRFSSVYGQFGARLPLPTLIMIGVSIAIRKYWYIFLIVLGLMVFGFWRFINSRGGRPIWDNFKLKVPVFGPLLTMLALSRFARITALLMKSGVPILEIMDLVGKASGNVIIGRAIMNIKESIKQGKGISEPMKVSGLFPPVVTQMVAVGEQTGKVDELLLSVADYYDRESGYMIKNLTTYIEPILIFVLALMVLVMALGIFMPMWNLIKVFKPG